LTVACLTGLGGGASSAPAGEPINMAIPIAVAKIAQFIGQLLGILKCSQCRIEELLHQKDNGVAPLIPKK
jgi:hypothetical protein